MKHLFIASITCLSACVLPPAARARSLNMIVVAEQTDRAAILPQPAADRPVSYAAYDGGYIEAGDPIAGEKPPTPAMVGQALRDALAARNFQPVGATGSPALALIYNWGVLNRDTIQIPRISKLKPNLRARIYLVASTRKAATLENYLLSLKAAPIPNDSAPIPGFLTPDLEDVLNRARDNHYFAVVSAYDFASLKRREPVLLWRVKLSTRSVGTSMDRAIPALIEGGRPYYGIQLPEARSISAEIPTLAGDAAAHPAMPVTAAGAGGLDADFLGHLVSQEHAYFAGRDVRDPAGVETPGSTAHGSASIRPQSLATAATVARK